MDTIKNNDKNFIAIFFNEKDISSIYKQNTSEYGDQAIRKVYSIAGLEDPRKEIKTDYNHC